MIDERACKLYAQMPEHKFLVNKTVSFIRWALARVKSPYLACSFGKDSSVMLHLVFNQFPNIPVVFVSRIETNLVDNYEQVISEWKNINLIDVRFEGNTFHYIDKSVIKTGMLQIQNSYDSYFVGLRSDESVGRRITLKKDGKFFLKKDGLYRICPVAFWSEMDIAAYCVNYNLPTLDTYKLNGFSARTTAGISSKTPEISIAALKNSNIAAYNQLLQILPDAKYFS